MSESRTPARKAGSKPAGAGTANPATKPAKAAAAKSDRVKKASSPRRRGSGGRFLPAAVEAVEAVGSAVGSVAGTALSAGITAISAGVATIAPGSKPRKKAKPKRASGVRSEHASRGSTKAAPSKAKPAAAPTTLTLLLIRHADAGDSATWQGDDAKRPLSKKGRREAKRLGDLLEALGVRPDAILTSPRVRAADTAKLVGKRTGTKVAIDDRLDAGFDRDRLSAILADLPASVGLVALVGHDPDFSVVASWLVGAQLSLAKGTLVRIELPGREIRPGNGRLRWLLPPDSVAG